MIFEKAPKLPEDLARLSPKETDELCNNIRDRLVEVVSKNGGHLASNLGVVELTVALYSVYNPFYDKIVWDVGHQSYVHKILTGRDEKFDTLRRFGGVSGFPKRSESNADAFNTGHSSTSISAALGMARAYKLSGDNRTVVAVIGDGALTGGMAYEALNDAAQSKCNIKIILNDNGMSIDKNVGGMSKYLGKIRSKHSYLKAKNRVRRFLMKIPFIGKKISHLLIRLKNYFKHIVVEGKFFEDLGLYYLGPVNGHDVTAMQLVFKRANEIDGPVLIHVQTQKGRGYEPAESQPEYFHGVNNFNPETGAQNKGNDVSMSKTFAKKLCDLAEKDNDIVAVTAAMSQGTGLELFANKFGDRFVDVGIAEQHAITMCAGMAVAGKKPVVAIYSSFLQRAFDQLVHDSALQKVPMVVGIDRAGVCGYDGETHHGIYDFAYVSSVPGSIICAPGDAESLEDMLEIGISKYNEECTGSLFAIRYPAKERFTYKENADFIKSRVEFGKGAVVFDNREAGKSYSLIVSIGEVLNVAFEAGLKLKEQGISSVVFDARFLRPFDEGAFVNLAEKAENIVTVEDAVKTCGLGETVEKTLFENRLAKTLTILAHRDAFIENDKISEQLKRSGITSENIVKICGGKYEA